MRANTQTGEFPLGDGHVASPALTKSGFLGSPLGEGASLFTDSPWPDTYSVAVPRVEMGYLLSFEGEKLVRIIASIERAEFGTSWDDWSMKKEKARYHAHTAWLKQIGLAADDYPWGSVVNVLEVRFGCSSILITYT